VQAQQTFQSKMHFNCCTSTKFVHGLHNLITPDITGIILGLLIPANHQYITRSSMQYNTKNQTQAKSYNLRSVLQTKDGNSNSPSVRHTQAV